MGFVKGSSKTFLFIGFLFILNYWLCVFAQESGNEEIKSYIVYLGERQHDDPELVSQSHHRMLESVFESPEAARASIIYNYRHGFSGFAARLTKSQAKKLSDRPDVFSVAPNKNLKLQATRINDYLGLSPILPKGILQESNMGSDLVMGILDSGIWPESPAFSDEGLGPIPKHWKGSCVAGDQFDPAKHCNKKLVGAKYFSEGMDKEYPGRKWSSIEYMSPRAIQSHGTICSSIGASSFVRNASFHGLAPGVMRGTAPKARVAMYKVSWDLAGTGTAIIDVVRAFDEAIKDGVDVLSVSMAPSGPPYNSYIGYDLFIGAFHAVMKGIPVVTGSANQGSEAYGTANGPPWFITVGATSIDRSLYVDMTLGNNLTIMGQAMYYEREITADLVYIEDWEKSTANVTGKVVLLFLKEDEEMGVAAVKFNGVGLIMARSSDIFLEMIFPIPTAAVDYEVGNTILKYIRSTSSPTITMSSGKTFVGRPKPTTLSGFSCRGPNAVSPAILKPDLVAPGVFLLAADVNELNKSRNVFAIAQGTSLSTPIVAGVVILLKALHPDWSPAALKSAIMTTAWKTDPSGQPIFAEGSPRKLADPFDYGAGLVNAERAKDPGLVYDSGLDDYIHYFCAAGFNDTSITVLTGKPTKCSSPLPSMLDFNYPAITIPDLEKEVTIKRTVTNVGPVDSVYRAVIEPPQGIKIAVEPETLVFNSSTKILGFKVRVSTSHKCNTGYFFGSFTWTDGTRNVTIPLSVRTRVLKP